MRTFRVVYRRQRVREHALLYHVAHEAYLPEQVVHAVVVEDRAVHDRPDGDEQLAEQNRKGRAMEGVGNHVGRLVDEPDEVAGRDVVEEAHLAFRVPHDAVGSVGGEHRYNRVAGACRQPHRVVDDSFPIGNRVQEDKLLGDVSIGLRRPEVVGGKQQRRVEHRFHLATAAEHALDLAGARGLASGEGVEPGQQRCRFGHRVERRAVQARGICHAPEGVSARQHVLRREIPGVGVPYLVAADHDGVVGGQQLIVDRALARLGRQLCVFPQERREGFAAHPEPAHEGKGPGVLEHGAEGVGPGEDLVEVVLALRREVDYLGVVAKVGYHLPKGEGLHGRTVV